MHRLFAAALAFTLVVALSFLIPGVLAQQASGTVTVEWLGWSHFRFTSPTGKVILTNPFTANPDSPVKASDITKADLILVPNGHGDEVGQAVEIAQKTGAKVFAPFELGNWLIEQGVPASQAVRAQPGDRYKFEGITIRMLSANHGSGLSKPSAAVPYGGPATGFMITFENGWTVYFAGSSPAMADQALYATMYMPHMAILHLGQLASGHDPIDFAMQVRQLQTFNNNLRVVWPHHLRADSKLNTGTTVAEAQAEVSRMGLGIAISEPKIGDRWSFAP